MDVRSTRTAAVRIIAAEMNTWQIEIAHPTIALVRGLLAGTLSADIIDRYPEDDYPDLLSAAIIHQLGLKTYAEDHSCGVSSEEIGSAIDALRGLRTGDMGIEETGGTETWQFYQNDVEQHGLTIEQLRVFTTSLTLEQTAQLIVDAAATPHQQFSPGTVSGTGGFVKAWLRPGDATWKGAPVPDGQHGMQITGGVTELTGTPDQLAAFGERVAMRWQSPLITALIELGAGLHDEAQLGNDGLFRALTCGTADTLAKTLALAGHFDTAVQALALHGEADDDQDIDRHAHLRDLGRRDEQATPGGQTVEYELRDAAAADYLRDLLQTS
jgi:hypothetical protein